MNRREFLKAFVVTAAGAVALPAVPALAASNPSVVPAADLFGSVRPRWLVVSVERLIPNVGRDAAGRGFAAGVRREPGEVMFELSPEHWQLSESGMQFAGDISFVADTDMSITKISLLNTSGKEVFFNAATGGRRSLGGNGDVYTISGVSLRVS